MVVERDTTGGRVNLHQEPPENSCRPAVDVLFRSVAQVFGPRVLSVVLTGMGQDGLRGCEAVKAAGGQVFVQDEASSVVWGMPGIVAKTGLADKILPLSQLGVEILRRAEEGRIASGAQSMEWQVNRAAQQH
jgi:two-component system chemotaxis response regulator CheB